MNLTAAPAVLDNDAQHAASFASLIRTFPGEFTAEDTHEWAEARQLPTSALGSLFSAAAKAGVIRHVGWTKASKPSSRGRWLMVWAVVR